jgi:hypothetical protein
MDAMIEKFREEAELDGWKYERPVFQLFHDKPSFVVRCYMLIFRLRNAWHRRARP